KLTRLPRMADFATWVCACEPALGLEEGAFLRAYRGNVKDANEIALGESPLVVPLQRFLEGQDGRKWIGPGSDLLTLLTGYADATITASADWPKRANALSGRLRRLAPNLRKTGISIEFVRTGVARHIALTLDSGGFSSSRSSRSSSTDERSPG